MECNQEVDLADEHAGSVRTQAGLNVALTSILINTPLQWGVW